MINLSPELRESAFVNQSDKTVVWHFKNAHDEYFTHIYFLDAAYTPQVHTERIRDLDFSNDRVYKLHDNLTTQFVEPTDQDWHPAPVHGNGIMSLQQYFAMVRIPVPKEDIDV